MYVHLSPELEGFINDQVESGFYRNASEVVRDALRRMQAEESRAQPGRKPSKRAMTRLIEVKGLPTAPRR